MSPLGFAACQSKKAQKHIGVKTCKQYAPKGQKYIGGCVKSRKRYAPKGQHHIAQGNALGKHATHQPYAL